MNLFLRTIVLAFSCFLVMLVVINVLPWVLESTIRTYLMLLLIFGNRNACLFYAETIVNFVVYVIDQLSLWNMPFLRGLWDDVLFHTYETSVNESLLSEIRKQYGETGVEITDFYWDTIVAGTNNFADSQIIARGKSGATTIYSMALVQPSEEIAVKKFPHSSGINSFKEFLNEIVLLPKLEHPNIIKLIGYCIEGKEKLLVYELMPPRSLDTLLQISTSLCKDRLKSNPLHQWSVRFKLIIGIAEGVAYLHEYSGLRGVHGDLKLSNILLDKSMMNPKISGFGSAQGLNIGVMSPEYSLKMKSDIYSFGVIVLAMMSGKMVTTVSDTASLIDYAKTVKSKDTVYEMVQDTLTATHVPDEAWKCLQVGLLCTQQDPDSRPTISSVLETLQGDN